MGLFGNLFGKKDKKASNNNNSSSYNHINETNHFIDDVHREEDAGRRFNFNFFGGGDSDNDDDDGDFDCGGDDD